MGEIRCDLKGKNEDMKRRLIEGITDKNFKCIITFKDFKKAFDSVHRRKILNILKAYGIPDTIVQAINVMYRNTQAGFF